MLQVFVESEQTSLRFSSSLTGSERKCVHQVNLIVNLATLLISFVIIRFLKKLDFCIQVKVREMKDTLKSRSCLLASKGLIIQSRNLTMYRMSQLV